MNLLSFELQSEIKVHSGHTHRFCASGAEGSNSTFVILMGFCAIFGLTEF
jgi:hypothetical protein